jgi:hypothetical protein
MAVMSLPPWLFDELADNSDDRDDLISRAIAWEGLLAGAEEVPRGSVFDMWRYRELRAKGVGTAPVGVWVHTGFWRPVVDP